MLLEGLLEIYWRWLGVAVVGDFGIEDSGGEWLKGDTELDCDGRGMRPRNTGSGDVAVEQVVAWRVAGDRLSSWRWNGESTRLWSGSLASGVAGCRNW